ncbi:FkbM family methyltransferase [Nitrospinota bacterium]
MSVAVEMMYAVKQVILDAIFFLLGRRVTIRLSRALRNRAMGENHDFTCSRLNGEPLVAERLLEWEKSQNQNLIIFDVGANVGDWSCMFMETAVKKGLSERIGLHAFEPSLDTYRLLEENVNNRGWKDRVTMVHSGMGSRTGDAILYVDEMGSARNSLYKRRLKSRGWDNAVVENVTLTTIDEYSRCRGIDRILFLKVDAEGHELEILRGAEEFLDRKSIDIIQFEYGNTWVNSRTFFVDMWDYVTKFGYHIGKIMPKGIEYYSRYDERLETHQRSDFLAILPEHANIFRRIKPWLD